jgi:hypothetical protein
MPARPRARPYVRSHTFDTVANGSPDIVTGIHTDVSADGSTVVFVAGPGTSPFEPVPANVHAWTLATAQVDAELISATTSGDPAASDSTSPTITADGSFVVFQSNSLELRSSVPSRWSRRSWSGSISPGGPVRCSSTTPTARRSPPTGNTSSTAEVTPCGCCRRTPPPRPTIRSTNSSTPARSVRCRSRSSAAGSCSPARSNRPPTPPAVRRVRDGESSLRRSGPSTAPRRAPTSSTPPPPPRRAAHTRPPPTTPPPPTPTAPHRRPVTVPDVESQPTVPATTLAPTVDRAPVSDR